MESIQFYLTTYGEFIFLFGGFTLFFLILYSFTEKKFRNLMVNLFFLFVTFLASFSLTGVDVFLTLPFFIFFISNSFNSKTFKQLLEIEEDEVFKTQKPQNWSRFSHSPELKDFDENIETQKPNLEEEIHE
ncbi:MAG: hypothetical protein ACTSVZ_13340 [Promethearchaeota archaeon]